MKNTHNISTKYSCCKQIIELLDEEEIIENNKQQINNIIKIKSIII
jgi:hypothetical protein